MAQIEVEIAVTRRWFFWPAMLIIVALGKCGFLHDQQRAAKWLADHAMCLEVRDRG